MAWGAAGAPVGLILGETAMNRIAINRRMSLLLGALCCGAYAACAAAADGPGITVAGTGHVEAMPDVLELAATVSGKAALAGDAAEKYRGNKRRALEALGRLNIEGVSVEGSGLAVNSGNAANAMAALQAGQANQPKVADSVTVEERLTIRLSGIDAMSAENLLQAVSRMVDVAKDAGLAVGGGPVSMFQVQFRGNKPAALVIFRLSKVEAVRKKAYAAALQQARSKADYLAVQAGLRLGDIVAIRETPAPAGGGAQDGVSAYLALFGVRSSDQPEYTMTELKSVPVTVNLDVQFAIRGEE